MSGTPIASSPMRRGWSGQPSARRSCSRTPEDARTDGPDRRRGRNTGRPPRPSGDPSSFRAALARATISCRRRQAAFMRIPSRGRSGSPGFPGRSAIATAISPLASMAYRVVSGDSPAGSTDSTVTTTSAGETAEAVTDAMRRSARPSARHRDVPASCCRDHCRSAPRQKSGTALTAGVRRRGRPANASFRRACRTWR